MKISPAFRSAQLLTPVVLALASSACSTLVGNVKPVDEKSRQYQVNDLSRDGTTWVRLDPKVVAEAAGQALDPSNDVFSNEISDVTYQSKKTAAIISLNSACRKGRNEQVNLPAFANELTLGIAPIRDRKDTAIRVANVAAIQTTIEGMLSGEPTKLRTVVLQQSECIYDLMYISRPDKFSVHEADFTAFVSSLQLKK